MTTTPDEPLPEQGGGDDQTQERHDDVGTGAPEGDDADYRSGERYSGTEN